MKNIYKIANIIIVVECCFNYKSSPNLEDFLINTDTKDYDLKIIIKKDNGVIKVKGNLVYDDKICKIYQDNDKFYRETYFASDDRYSVMEYNNGNIMKCYISEEKIDKIWNIYDIFTMVGFDYLLFLNKAMILHSSFISYNNNGILFTAPSQTGKSTQADLWEKYQGAEIINGDRAGIKKEDGVFYGYGLPYAGSSKIYKNKREAIKTIIVLRQGKENKIRRLKSIESFKYLYSEIMVNTWNEEFINGISDMIMDLISKVPIYMMECLPDESAVNLLKKELSI